MEQEKLEKSLCRAFENVFQAPEQIIDTFGAVFSSYSLDALVRLKEDYFDLVAKIYGSDRKGNKKDFFGKSK